MGNIKK